MDHKKNVTAPCVPDADEEAIVVTQPVIDALANFLESHSPRHVSRSLRQMLLEFLSANVDSTVNNLDEILWDLEGLFNVLDVIEDEGLGEKDAN